MSLKQIFWTFLAVIIFVLVVFSTLYLKIEKQSQALALLQSSSQNSLLETGTNTNFQEKLDNDVIQAETKKEQMESLEPQVEREDKSKIIGERRIATLLLNYSSYEKTNLDPEVKAVLALASAGYNRHESPKESNNFKLSDMCQFSDENYGDTLNIKRIISKEIPAGYTVYNCEEDKYYGGGYYIHYQYEGGIPGTGTVGIISSWYGPFAPFLPFIQ